MRPIESVEEAIKRKLRFAAASTLRDRWRKEVLQAQEELTEMRPTRREPTPRRTIMRSPIAKLAVVAVILAVIGLGVLEFVSTGSNSGVVWAEVADKVENCSGFICHYEETRMFGAPYYAPESSLRIVALDGWMYVSPKHGLKQDLYEKGKPFTTTYMSIAQNRVVAVAHQLKEYLQEPLPVDVPGELASWADPQRLMKILTAKERKELGRRVVDGKEAEGIEVRSGIVVARIWVAVENQWPIRFEEEYDNGRPRQTMDKFRWDVDLDASVFEPNIPPDYTQM